MPLTVVDEHVPFVADTLWIYQSIYLLIGMVAFNLPDLRTYLNFSKGVMIVACLSLSIFFIYPTACLRPSTMNTSDFYQAFISMETSLNAFPSMHVSLTLFSLLSAYKYRLCSRKWLIILWIWGCLIMASTLFTKQHVFVDILGGAVLASGVHLVVNIYFKNKNNRLSTSQPKEKIQSVKPEYSSQLVHWEEHSI
jgi:membrane-associated phospholipid phosphatase